jgi:hypothetical protein
MAAELVLLEEFVPALGKFFFVLVLDCHEHYNPRTAVRPATVLV